MIPKAPKPSAEIDTEAKSSRDLTTDEFHVLVVHQDQEMLHALAHRFRDFGYQVTTAFDSAKALLYFGRLPCDLLFADLDMPGINGYDLACLIKKHRPQTKAVVTTRRSQEKIDDLKNDNIVDQWLFKPFTIKQLGNTLASIGMH